MNVEQFQYINNLNTGSTSYEEDLINYFGLDKTKNYDTIRKELSELIKTEPLTDIKDKFKVNGVLYGFEKELLEQQFDQYIQLDKLLVEDENVKNLHKLLAIYVRPLKRNWYNKLVIEPYDLKKQEAISNDILKMDIDLALGLMVFFYLDVMKCMNHISIYYLNQKKIQEKN